jgi:hypothetical protein
MGRKPGKLHDPHAGQAVGTPTLHLERRLSEILEDLAALLIGSGYGVSRMNRLVRLAYLNAAKSLGHEKETSNARIAALTGLTRIEVSRLSKQGIQQSDTRTPLNRAQRVAIGWVSDAEYCTRLGKPRALPFSGRSTSFSKLVRVYSGDIPARAMLYEMQRLNMVQCETNGSVRLLRVGTVPSKQTQTSLRALARWTRFLASGDDNQELFARTFQVKLRFDSGQQANAALRELERRVSAFVSGVEQLGQNERRSDCHEIDLSLAFATRAPAVKREKGQKGA